MGKLIGLLIGGIGALLGNIINKFLPYFLKKFGIGAVKFGINKAVSILVIGITVSFYFAVFVFLNETYSQFKDLIDLANNPSFSVTQHADIVNCALYLFNISGFTSGFTSAFHFAMSVFLFMFMKMAYMHTRTAMKIISDEVAKNLKYF